MAQAYPDSSASWCNRDLENSTLVSIEFVMGAVPDTVILGQSYKRIEEYTDSSTWGLDWQLRKRFYVRSDTTGKGYVMLLDSMQEYLAIDNNAQAGDTVQNVLIAGTWIGVPEYLLQSVVVDSITTIENNDVTVIRQFVHIANIPLMDPSSARMVFWQAGIGGAYGPILLLFAGDGFNEVTCLRMRDTYVYHNGPGGLPGIPCDCPLDLSVGLDGSTAGPFVAAYPNPSTGRFMVDARMRSATVYDATGRLLFEASGPQIDLSAYPPGLYHAVVQTAQGVRHVRLMVQR